MIYARAILTRSGLANRLFPWARCTVFASACGVPMLAPHWVQLKLGPLLRRERDLRLYYGQFRHLDSEVTGADRLWVASMGRRLPEPDDLTKQPTGRGVVTFEGLRDFFARLQDWNQLLAARIDAITRPDIVAQVRELQAAPIAMHVRRGDFRLGTMETPLSWFLDTLALLREAVGSRVEAFVVSDGHDDELQPLSREPGVRVIRTGTGLGDMLLLCRGRVVLGSRGSSFSAWASFLSGAPVATLGGSYADDFKLTRPGGAYVGVFDPRNPSPTFVADARSALEG